MHSSTHVSQTIDDSSKNTSENNSKTLTIEEIQKSGLAFDTGKIWHQFNFVPTIFSYDTASTYQDKWITVDYIFYTKFQRKADRPEPPKYSSIQLLANYSLPSVRNCYRMGAIPNHFFGSDHYLLASEFVLLKQ